MENRYSKGKVYKIVCNTTGLQYIGSTCEPTLARRLAEHKKQYVRYLKGYNNYITSYKVLENNNYEIVLIENCSCETKDQLYSRERFYIENNECVNLNIPNRKKKEYSKIYYEENKDRLIEYQKKYFEDNKDKLDEYIKQYRKQYRNKMNEKFICECGGKYTYVGKMQHLKTNKHKNYVTNNEIV